MITKRAEVSTEEFEIFQSDFNRFDTNQNGTLEADEVAQLLSAQSARQVTQEYLESYFAKNDANVNGVISLQEYITSIVGEWLLVTPEPLARETTLQSSRDS